MLFVSKGFQTECTKLDLSQIGEGTAPGTVGGVIAISSPVGIRGRNLPDDTVTIQGALNRVAIDQGGANPRLDVDGKCGPKTNKAIQVFQLKHFGWQGADGLVEPLKQTIAKLNLVAGSTFAAKATTASAPSSVVKLPDLTNSFRVVRTLLRAVDFKLTAAASHIERGLPLTPISEAGVTLVNKHFALDKVGFSSGKQRLFRIIRGVYNRMDQVLQRPGGLWGPATFEPDQLKDKNLAYTNYGGFFRNGQFRSDRGKIVRLDSIFISAAFTKLNNDDSRALVHIHELAHFVGAPELIDDHAYNFQEDGARMRRLRPSLRVLNAESYMNFAWEARHPRRPFPPGV
jgi:hypothetical protein